MKHLKLIVMVLAIILIIPSADAVLNDSIVYYSFDNSAINATNDPHDLSGNSENGTTNGAPQTGVTGILGEAFVFDGVNDWISRTSIPIRVGILNNFTSCLWAKFNQTTDSAADNYILNFDTDMFYVSQTNLASQIELGYWDGGWTKIDNNTAIKNTIDYYHICIRHNINTSAIEIIINNTIVVSSGGTGKGVPIAADVLGIAARGTNGAAPFNGTIDEFGIWDRYLSDAELSTLFNSGAGFNPYSVAAPAAGSVVSIDQSTYNMTSASSNGTAWRTDTLFLIPTSDSTPTVTFTANISSNCSIGTTDQSYALMIAGDANRKCGTVDTTLHTCTLPATDPLIPDQNDIYISCSNGSILDPATSTSGRLWTVMDSPSAALNFSDRYIGFSVPGTETTYLSIPRYWHLEDLAMTVSGRTSTFCYQLTGTNDCNSTSSQVGTYVNFTIPSAAEREETFMNITIVDALFGNSTINLTIPDECYNPGQFMLNETINSSCTFAIKQSTVTCYNDSNWNVIYSTGNCAELGIGNPAPKVAGINYFTDRTDIGTFPINVSIDVGSSGANEFYAALGSFNFSNSPQRFNYSNLTEAINKYLRWNCTTDPCLVPIDVYSDGGSSVRFGAMGAGWAYPSSIYSHSFDYLILETSQANLSSVILFAVGENPIVNLIYNGTSYPATQTLLNANNATYLVNVPIPLISDPFNETRDFHWNVTDTVGTWSSNSTNQTVVRMYITNFTAPAITSGINFSILDEITNASVISDVISNWQFWSSTGDGSLRRNYTNSMVGSSIYNFTLYPAWGDLTYDLTFNYEAVGYPPRQYIVNEGNLDNISELVLLYLIDDNNATTFKLTVRDSDYQLFDGVIVRTLKYDAATNSYLAVESCVTDDNAQCLTHLELETVDYRFMVVYSNGSIMHTTNPARFTCPGAAFGEECVLTVLIPSDASTSIWNYGDTGLSIIISNTSVTTSLTYSFVPGEIDYVRFIVSNSSSVICDTNSSAVAGVITCNIAGQSGIITQQVRIFTNGVELIVRTEYLDFTEAWERYGTSGVFVLILILLAIGVGSLVTGSPIAMIILTLAALGISVFTGIGGVSLGMLLILSTVGAFLIYKLKQ